MATIKSYTDIEQSRKLAEILPLESADMNWTPCDNGKMEYYKAENERIVTAFEKKYHIPCWSFAALLNAVDFNTINLHYDNARTDWVVSATIHDSTKHCTKYESTRALNPVDACYEMIVRLHGLNLL